MIVDLHMHTTCSDGIYSPEALTKMAVEAHLDVIAISDHDTVAAYAAPYHLNAGTRIIPAIEMSSDYEGEDVHVLGYYLDTADADLLAYCAQFKERRFRRALEIIDRCISLGYILDRGYLEKRIAEGSTIGRPHIARMLVKKGYFSDVKSVFDTLLYRGGPAYVPYHRKTIHECIDLIHHAGGIAVLAHRGLLRKVLTQVLTHPFDGIEVYHPKNEGRYEEFLEIAEQKGWYVSGGSDFHGVPGRFPEQLGVFVVEAKQVERFLNYQRN